jgi:hypothetical protein
LAYGSVKREVLYNILTEFGVSMKVVRLLKMCLKSVGCISYSQWSEIKRCFIAIAFQFLFRISHQEGPRKGGRIGNEWNTSAYGLS